MIVDPPRGKARFENQASIQHNRDEGRAAESRRSGDG